MGRRREGEHLGKVFYALGPCTNLYLSPNSKARMTSPSQSRVVILRLSKILTVATAGLSSMLRPSSIAVAVLGYIEASGRM